MLMGGATPAAPPAQTPPAAAASPPEAAASQQAPDAAEELVNAADPPAGLQAGQQRIVNDPEPRGLQDTGADASGSESSGPPQDLATGQAGEQCALL